MIIKRLTQKQKNGIQLITMIFLTCLSQVIALYKSRFTAVSFGATSIMDAYNYALNIATFIFVFVTSGVTTVVIPAYVRKKSLNAINSFITIIYGSILLIVALVLIIRVPLVTLMTNKGDEFVAMVGSFLLVTFFIQAITSFLAVTAAYYQCINHYIIPKAILLLSNAIVAGILITGIVKDINIYLGLLVAGSIVNLLFDLGIAIKLGFRYAPSLSIHDPELKKMLIIFLPTLFSSGVYKIHTLVDTLIASTLISGMLTILSYSTQIITMVNNVVIGNLTVYAYPKIVARMNRPDCKKFFWTYSIFFHAVVCMIIAGFFNVGLEGVSLIFLGGKFTIEDTYMLYYCVCIYMFGQQFNVVRDLIYRFFYANGDTKETLKNSVMVSFFNIILSLIFVQFLGVIGIIIATVLSSLLSLIVIIFRFNQNYGIGIKRGYFLWEHGKNLIALMVSIMVVQLLKQTIRLNGALIPILIYGCITVLVFLGMLFLLRSDIRKISF